MMFRRERGEPFPELLDPFSRGGREVERVGKESAKPGEKHRIGVAVDQVDLVEYDLDVFFFGTQLLEYGKRGLPLRIDLRAGDV